MKKTSVQKNAAAKRSYTVVPGREVSAMAWIENEFGNVLMVRQAQGNKLWTLPGGKVRTTEDVAKALEREVREETGLSIAKSQLDAIYDRISRGCLAILFSVTLKPGTFQPKSPEEIMEIAFKSRLPSKASPSAKYFWTLRRSTQKVRNV